VKRVTRGVALSSLALSIALVALPARASATAPATAAAASIPGLKTPGTLTFGTNFGYPPMEMFTGPAADQQTGADVDLGKAIATKLHLTPFFFNVTDFGVILTGLQTRRWDIILSSLNVTPARQKTFNFIPYANVGQSILVRKGNPEHIMGIADLSGKSVAAQSATVEVDSIKAQNKLLASKHKALIKLSVFPEDTTAIQGLATGRFDAVLDDYPVAVYNATKKSTLFQLAGQQFAPAPYGMAFRKSDKALLSAVQGAFDALRKDGTYAKIMKKYGLGQAILK